MKLRPGSAIAHLRLRLGSIHRALASAVVRREAAASRLARPDLSPFCVSGEQVRCLLDELGTLDDYSGPAVLTPEEDDLEDQLRNSGEALPLDRLTETLDLTAFEQDALLICAAPELDRSYERIFAFILDDLNRRFPCADLLASLTASSAEQCVLHRHALALHGKLRRYELLAPIGDAVIEARQEFRLGPGLFEYLTGGGPDMSLLCRDRGEVPIPRDVSRPAQIDAHQFDHFCDLLRSGALRTIGIWGPRRNGGADLVLSLASALNRPLRRLIVPEADAAHSVRSQIRTGSALDAVLWLDSDPLAAEVLAASPVPIFITSEQRWPSVKALMSGSYAEIELADPSFESREELWLRAVPELDRREAQSLASRYSLAASEVESVSQLARIRAKLLGNGIPEPVNRHVASACSIVTRRSSCRFATPIIPRRTAADLVLSEPLHRQILEVAKFFELRPRVDEDWGFGRMAGTAGLKVLFTGDPGTGKTLSAEVIAGTLGLPLYKVDLARIVSKWVGETERNLDDTFAEAEQSNSVLFFDEAEALFGKRGEVQNGTDRYANLEVSYLLQRLETSSGLVILASNVKDQIDQAFIRRFQVVVHFPRPALPERSRMWRIAFPASAPMADLDIPALARLDMTGAAIMNAARTAAMLAADSDSPSITMGHVIHAAARQYRREARVLTPADLGSYGSLLQGTP